jgi:hypothetical protein
MSSPEQPPRHVRTHSSKTNHANLHMSLLLSEKIFKRAGQSNHEEHEGYEEIRFFFCTVGKANSFASRPPPW